VPVAVTRSSGATRAAAGTAIEIALGGGVVRVAPGVATGFLSAVLRAGEIGTMVVPARVRVLIATQPVDFHKDMDGLAALAREKLGQDPYSSVVLVFRSKCADRVKLLLWDGSGLVLVSKRLEQGGFKWPPIVHGMMRLSPAQLAALLEGLDWSRVHVPRVMQPRAVQ
jgi:transposase